MSMFGAIALHLGTAGAIGFVSDPYLIVDATGTPGLSRSELQLNQTGNAVRRLRQNQSDGDIGSWGSGPLTMADYDFMMEQITGSLSSAASQAADVWINGFDGMRWGVETTFGAPIFTGTLRVRPAGGGGDLDTAACTIQAEST